MGRNEVGIGLGRDFENSRGYRILASSLGFCWMGGYYDQLGGVSLKE